MTNTFMWKHALRRQDIIISKVKQRGAKKYTKKTMKFGIEFHNVVQ